MSWHVRNDCGMAVARKAANAQSFSRPKLFLLAWPLDEHWRSHLMKSVVKQKKRVYRARSDGRSAYNLVMTANDSAVLPRIIYQQYTVLRT